MEDFDNIPKIRQQTEQLNHLQLQVGIFGEDGSYMQMIAAANEYGADITPKKGKWLTIPTENTPKGKSARDIDGLFRPKGKNILAVSDGKGGLTVMFYLVDHVKIPERSFIRSTFDEKADEWTEFAADEVVEMALESELDARTVLENLGARIQKDIQARIRAIESPKNAPATVARKGSSSPLEDTGHLIQAVTYKVVGD